LQGWQKADQVTVLLYGIIETFPEDERYGLVGQIKCAGSAIPANMAECWGRGGDVLNLPGTSR
jgi:four helix bundle protein